MLLILAIRACDKETICRFGAMNGVIAELKLEKDKISFASAQVRKKYIMQFNQSQSVDEKNKIEGYFKVLDLKSIEFFLN